MISKKWSELVNALADRGVPLYVVTDPLDDAGLPSWAVLLAILIIFMAMVVFVVFPVAKARLDVTTTPGAKVIVSYGEERLSKIADGGNAVFSVPLGSSVSITISKNGCENGKVDVELVDSYSVNKMLSCDK